MALDARYFRVAPLYRYSPTATPVTPAPTPTPSVTPTPLYSSLYSFQPATDQFSPTSGLAAVNGVLYGETKLTSASQHGIVFSITTTGSESTLYRFGGAADGSTPSGGLINVNGTLFGTTAGYGLSGDNGDYGTVFMVSTSSQETVLYRFTGGTDGGTPEAGLVNVNGTLYATTVSGGANNNGTIFKLSLSGIESAFSRPSFAARSVFHDDGVKMLSVVRFLCHQHGPPKNARRVADGCRQKSAELLS